MYKKIKKRTYLQSVLSAEPNKYDFEWYGDEMDRVPKNNLHFWFQNCNGLINRGDTREFQFDIANMADCGINYFSFSETCVNSNKPGYTRKLSEAFNQIIPTDSMSFTNTPDYPTRSNYQPGGVASGFDGSLRTRFLKQGKDPLGRWMWQEFGHGSRILRVYNIYRVNDGSEFSSGENTAWSQQKRQFLPQNISTNPRKYVMTEIVREIKSVIGQGTNVMVGGDFNKDLLSPEQMGSMIASIGLYNVFASRMDTNNLPRTHMRSSKAVDHIWVSKYVLDNITYAGIAPFGHTYGSDHRGMFIDLDEKMLFNPEDVRIVYHDHRRLKSRTPKRVKKYMKMLQTEWDLRKIKNKYMDLVENTFHTEDKDNLTMK